MSRNTHLNARHPVTVAVLFISAALLLLAAATQSQAEPSGKIAYTAFSGEYVPDEVSNGEIYVMNADGSGKTQLTNNPAWDRHPEWSPNGRKIAFISHRDDTTYGGSVGEIYVMNADGSDQRRLTTGGLVYPWYSGLSWSKDGRKIAFSSVSDENGDANFDIYTVNARDGSDRTRLTDSPAFDIQPDFSPNGKKIAFRSSQPDDPWGQGDGNIYTMNARDGSDKTRLTETEAPAVDAQPEWSPSGREIAFTSTRDRIYQVYRMNADGSGETNVTNSLINSVWPDWSPNGRQIAFHNIPDDDPVPGSSVLDNREIFTMNADGSNQQNVTRTPDIDELWPSWDQGRHDSSRITN